MSHFQSLWPCGHLPEALLVSAGGALLPPGDGDVAFLLRLADWQLVALGVPAEEGATGVAGDATVMDPGLAQLLVTDFAGYLGPRVGHFVISLLKGEKLDT